MPWRWPRSPHRRWPPPSPASTPTRTGTHDDAGALAARALQQRLGAQLVGPAGVGEHRGHQQPAVPAAGRPGQAAGQPVDRRGVHLPSGSTPPGDRPPRRPSSWSCSCQVTGRPASSPVTDGRHRLRRSRPTGRGPARPPSSGRGRAPSASRSATASGTTSAPADRQQLQVLRARRPPRRRGVHHPAPGRPAAGSAARPPAGRAPAERRPHLGQRGSPTGPVGSASRSSSSSGPPGAASTSASPARTPTAASTAGVDPVDQLPVEHVVQAVRPDPRQRPAVRRPAAEQRAGAQQPPGVRRHAPARPSPSSSTHRRHDGLAQPRVARDRRQRRRPRVVATRSSSRTAAADRAVRRHVGRRQVVEDGRDPVGQPLVGHADSSSTTSSTSVTVKASRTPTAAEHRRRPTAARPRLPPRRRPPDRPARPAPSRAAPARRAGAGSPSSSGSGSSASHGSSPGREPGRRHQGEHRRGERERVGLVPGGLDRAAHLGLRRAPCGPPASAAPAGAAARCAAAGCSEPQPERARDRRQSASSPGSSTPRGPRTSRPSASGTGSADRATSAVADRRPRPARRRGRATRPAAGRGRPAARPPRRAAAAGSRAGQRRVVGHQRPEQHVGQHARSLVVRADHGGRVPRRDPRAVGRAPAAGALAQRRDHAPPAGHRPARPTGTGAGQQGQRVAAAEARARRTPRPPCRTSESVSGPGATCRRVGSSGKDAEQQGRQLERLVGRRRRVQHAGGTGCAGQRQRPGQDHHGRSRSSTGRSASRAGSRAPDRRTTCQRAALGDHPARAVDVRPRSRPAPGSASSSASSTSASSRRTSSVAVVVAQRQPDRGAEAGARAARSPANGSRSTGSCPARRRQLRRRAPRRAATAARARLGVPAHARRSSRRDRGLVGDGEHRGEPDAEPADGRRRRRRLAEARSVDSDSTPAASSGAPVLEAASTPVGAGSAAAGRARRPGRRRRRRSGPARRPPGRGSRRGPGRPRRWRPRGTGPATRPRRRAPGVAAPRCRTGRRGALARPGRYLRGRRPPSCLPGKLTSMTGDTTGLGGRLRAVADTALAVIVLGGILVTGAGPAAAAPRRATPRRSTAAPWRLVPYDVQVCMVTPGEGDQLGRPGRRDRHRDGDRSVAPRPGPPGHVPLDADRGGDRHLPALGQRRRAPGRLYRMALRSHRLPGTTGTLVARAVVDDDGLDGVETSTTVDTRRRCHQGRRDPAAGGAGIQPAARRTGARRALHRWPPPATASTARRSPTMW